MRTLLVLAALTATTAAEDPADQQASDQACGAVWQDYSRIAGNEFFPYEVPPTCPCFATPQDLLDAALADARNVIGAERFQGDITFEHYSTRFLSFSIDGETAYEALAGSTSCYLRRSDESERLLRSSPVNSEQQPNCRAVVAETSALLGASP